jgi:hypothetical protein
MSQKFHRGDLVHVAKDLGPSMFHFTADVDAIVIGSYQDQYGGGHTKDYTLYLKGSGECSWYHESQLELLETGKHGLLDEWKAAKAAEDKLKGDIDWIFAHGSEVLRGAHGATVATLAKGVGVTNLWGSHGEGIAYHENAMRVLSLAEPFLERGDKAGWLAFCEQVKIPTVDYDFHEET